VKHWNECGTAGVETVNDVDRNRRECYQRCMIDIVKRFFGKSADDDRRAQPPGTDHDVRVATCALLVEIARIDNAFTDAELETILSILEERYGLSHQHARAVVSEAEKTLEASVDLWHFARLINENYSNEEKMATVEMLWRVVYVDGKMERHEHFIMSKLQKLLRISHSQLIEAKLKVKSANG
jgi:uncharacterized tellurite resistance protein B-like protein